LWLDKSFIQQNQRLNINFL